MNNSASKKVTLNYYELSVFLFFSNDLIYAIFNSIFPQKFSRLICIFIIYLPIILVFLHGSRKKRIVNKIHIDFYILLGIVLLFFMITLLFNPDYYDTYFTTNYWNIFNSVFNWRSGIFAYLFIRLLENKPYRLLSVLELASWSIFVYGTIRIFSTMNSIGYFTAVNVTTGAIVYKSYDISLGYKLVLALIILSVTFLKDKRKINLLPIIMLFIEIVLWGSRGAIFSYVIFIALYVMFGENNRVTVKKITYSFIGIVIVIFILSDPFKQYLSNFVQKYDINSRTINYFIEESTVLDKGRNDSWETTWELIKEKPIIGNGAYSDRYYFNIYCHQFILEIMLNFGMLFGSMILVILLFGTIKMLIKCNDRNYRLIFIIFFSATCFKLTVSSSFWIDSTFWACIASYVNYFKNKNINSDYIKNENLSSLKQYIN